MIADELPFYKIGEKHHYTKEDGIEVDSSINELGYRSSLVYPCENYYLAVGCSNTFGMYLDESDRYSNIVEKQTNIPVLNIGVRGASAYMNMLNLLKLRYSNYPMPQAIFCQWPEPARLTFPIQSNKGDVLTITPHHKEFRELYQSDVLEYNSRIAYDTVHEIFKDQKIIEFSMSDPTYSNFYNVEHIRLCDFAKDKLHAGPSTHNEVAKYIMENI